MTQAKRQLVDLGDGVFAWTQLPGSWGWSNAGLIVDGDESLLVDTLFDLKLTAEMLAAMRDASPAAKRIGTVVNTHGNGDHCYGNGLVADAEIIATQGCVDDLRAAPPDRNALLLKAGKVISALGPVGHGLGRALSIVGVDRVKLLADAAPLALSLFSEFEFAGNEIRLPDRTFTQELTLTVGDKDVQLIELGPAHTRGDAIVVVPDDRVVFTGDLLFHQSHPVIWEGPVSNWIGALERILALDVDTVVPGHGPITDKDGVRGLLAYLHALTDEARARYDAGMPLDDAVVDIHLDGFDSWLDEERLYVNVHTLYRDFAEDRAAPDILEMFAGMGRFARDPRRRARVS
jgi:glyoxylase-like metal-dependent hydrolase (beta-lactamase superfamily II)